ncbi:C39 family peptidase [Kribbella sp. NPDC050459]|uniref:C39 family peptidase n=1 Tax=Kribbella sp. NPDC050459 TaxID=3155785 RepID=UPI0033E67008
MRTAARGATLVLLGALLVQAPLTAQAYQPREPEFRTGPTGPTTPTPEPTAEPKSSSGEPAARSWSEVVKQVSETSPGDVQLRSADTSAQAASMLRCFKLDAENYCLGLGFVQEVPTGSQRHALMAEPSLRAADEVGAEQDISTGDLTPAAFVAERAALPKTQRVTAELDEMEAAWNGRAKARELRELAEAETPPPNPETQQTPRSAQPTAPTTPPDEATTAPTSTPTVTPTGTPTVAPTRTAPTGGTPTAVPTTPVAPVAAPASAYLMKGFQTSQEKGYWCGPATFQSIDWADDNQKDTQASWAKDLGSTTSGTAISAMVKQTNLKTAWPKSAGTYIVQNVSHWTAQTFFTVHQKHLGVYKAPVIEHVQLLKRYFPYLAFNHSGHYQVGRGYDQAKGTIAIFEVFNERRFNSRGNVTDGPKNIPASALFNATLANSFQNIGL